MISIILAFPKKETAVQVRGILLKGGFETVNVCTTGAQALQCIDLMDEGIVICGYKLSDMMYTELRECIPDQFKMLMITSPERCGQDAVKGVIELPMPVKVYDLINTVEMMVQSMYRRRKRQKAPAKRRNPREKALIGQAKALLMERNHMSEEEAHRYIQKISMDSGTNMLETAQMVLTIMEQ